MPIISLYNFFLDAQRVTQIWKVSKESSAQRVNYLVQALLYSLIYVFKSSLRKSPQEVKFKERK